MPTSMLNLWNSQVRNFRDPAFRNRYYYNMSKFPVVGDLIRYQDSMNYWSDYFRNRPGSGGWANVKYPSMMAGAGNITAHSRASLGFVSKNLTKLYDKPGKPQGYWTPAPEPHRRIRTYVGPIRGTFRYYGY